MTSALEKAQLMKEIPGIRTGQFSYNGPPLPGIPKGPRGQIPIPPERGIASITHKGKTLRFRTNPNEIWWDYNLNPNIENTFGGRVIQLLSANIDNLVVKVDSGGGRWEYKMEVVKFMRDLLVDQRMGEPATFEYTTRGWILDVYAVSVPFNDDVNDVLKPIELNFKVQEDVSGLMSKLSLSSELARLKDGLGWHQSKYNQPNPSDQKDGESGYEGMGSIADDIAGAVSGLPVVGGFISGIIAQIPGLASIPGIGG